MATIVTLASHVARGHVGNSVTVFALQRLGHEVWHLPTVMLPYHPGHGSGHRIVTPADQIEHLLADLADNAPLDQVSAVLTGYLGSADQAAPIAGFIEKVKARAPNLLYVCDPVLGDGDALYVYEGIARAIRDHLVPIADVITPNLFELGWLTGKTLTDGSDTRDAARGLSVKNAFVTSAPALMRNHTGMMAVTDTLAMMAEAPTTAHPPHGLGDLSAALVLSHMLKGEDVTTILRRTLASVHDLAIQTDRRRLKEIPLAAEQHRLLQSAIAVQIRTLAEIK